MYAYFSNTYINARLDEIRFCAKMSLLRETAVSKITLLLIFASVLIIPLFGFTQEPQKGQDDESSNPKIRVTEGQRS